MKWQMPQYSKRAVDQAGAELALASGSFDVPLVQFVEAYSHALTIVNNWRSSHSFPLNSLQVNLRHNAKRVYEHSLISQRIKRLPSIELKLRRFDTIRLSQMQDIGGCRAVVRSVRDVKRIVDVFGNSRANHTLHHPDDYIMAPQASGYRGVHLIYRYCSNSPKTAPWHGLKIEIQVRSRFQHAWATAVETVGTFIQQALKSSQGEDEWLRFFALMGSALARREGTPSVPGTPDNARDLKKELRRYMSLLDVERRLTNYSKVIRTFYLPKAKNARYFLLLVDPAAGLARVRGYQGDQLEQAMSAYLETERQIAGKVGAEAVLASVDSVRALRRAYPSYFLDTRLFLNALREAI